MKEDLEKYFDRILNESLQQVHRKGFTYFHHGFMPRLLEAGKIKDFNREMLAAGWTLAGEIYALNQAPKRSVDCLKKALVLKPDRIETLHAIIEQLNAIGEYHTAFAYIDQLLNLVPDRMEFITLRQQIQDDINYDTEPKFAVGNTIWELNEQLAAEQFNAVINTVLDSEMDTVDLLKKLACAYGAVGHYANYHQIWKTIKNMDSTATTDPVDLFYQPINA